MTLITTTVTPVDKAVQVVFCASAPARGEVVVCIYSCWESTELGKQAWSVEIDIVDIVIQVESFHSLNLHHP